MPEDLNQPWTLQRFTIVLLCACAGLIGAFVVTGRITL